MCGIAAISLPAGTRESVRRALERMNDAQIARGPNGSGVMACANGGVGMVRLRVRANQDEPEPIPLDGRQTAAYNGEIYWQGDTVPTGGEGEVRALRKGCVDGMYALACMDGASGVIDVQRDPFGIKPLWRRRVDGGVAVASTIHSLLAGVGPDTPRFDGVQQFLAFGRPIDGRSMLDTIEAVPRGSQFRLRDGICTKGETLEPVSSDDLGDPRNPRVLRAALQRAIRRVLPSNQVIGLAVSGGLDSTILAHQMAEMGIEDLRTVSVLVDGVDDGVEDLSRLQIPHRAVKSWRHRTITVTPDMFAQGFERAARDLGEPTRLSSVPLYGALADVAKAAGIVVLQVGEGADELFMGYSSYRSIDTTEPDFPFLFMLPPARHAYLAALYGDGVIERCREVYRQTYPLRDDISALERLRRIELDHSLEPLLQRADQILMSRSIEGRTPFLHGDVPQLALSLTVERHLSGAHSKPMLRAAFPEIDRLDGPWRRKTPFRAPVARWLQTTLRPWMTRALDEGGPVLRELGLREDGIALVRRDALDGKAPALDMALALMSLVFWAGWLGDERWSDGHSA